MQQPGRHLAKPRPPTNKRRGPKVSVRFDAAILQSARESSDWTQQELAHRAGIDVSLIWRAEKGRPVSTETARAIGSAFNRPFEGMLFSEESPNPALPQSFPDVPIFGGDIPPRIRLFVGRGDELGQLHAILADDKLAAITQAVSSHTSHLSRASVRGMGGIGKTSLAIEYIHRYRDHYDGIWWCSAGHSIQLLTGLANLATALGAAGTGEVDIERAAKKALRFLAERRGNFLLVYDNVETPRNIEGLLPANGARVLITSRFSDWGDWAEEVELDVLPLTKAVKFLQCRAKRKDEVGATTLSHVLGRLPLALDHAAAYCKQTPGMTFDEYAGKAKKLIDIAPTGTPYPNSIYATFCIAIESAAQRCALAETLMDYLAHCAPDRIPMTLIEGAIEDQAERTRALLALTEMSLVKQDPFDYAQPGVSVHRLVSLVVQVRAEAKGSAQSAIERVAQRLAAIYPDYGSYDLASWPMCDQLLPHLLERFLTDTAESDTAADLQHRAASYFLGRGIYSNAKTLYGNAMLIREKLFGPVHPVTAESLSHFGNALFLMGDPVAEQILECALTIQEKTLASDDPNILTSLSGLAGVFQAKNEFAKAKPLFERALAITEKIFGPEHLHTAGCLHNLVSLSASMKDFKGARPLCERALSIREKILGPQHPQTAASLVGLAVLLEAEGDVTGAQTHYECALSIYEKTLGSWHPDTMRTLGNIANLLHGKGNLAEARQLYERALMLQQEALGLEHPETVQNLQNLIKLLTMEGDVLGLRPLYERLLAIVEKRVGPEHSAAKKCRDILVSLNDIAKRA